MHRPPDRRGIVADLRDRPSSPLVSRTELLSPEALTPRQRELYDAIVGGPRRAATGQVPIDDEQGRLLGPFGLMLLSPEIGDAVQRVGAALRFGGSMSARSRELAILTVAATKRSAFEWWAHERAGEAAGLTPGQLQQILDGDDVAGLEATDETVVRTARSLVRRGNLDDTEFAEADRVLGQDGLAELVWLVGYYSTLALALEVFTPPNPF
jgi:4-carboxymuconolactone decarboxylase